MLIGYHRGKMESIKHSEIYERYANLGKGCDYYHASFSANTFRYYFIKKTTFPTISPAYLICHRYANLGKGCDMIIGYIANDRMFVVLDRFFNGEITDLALINSLSALKLGKQYVALTATACKKIKILEEKALTEENSSRIYSSPAHCRRS